MGDMGMIQRIVQGCSLVFLIVALAQGVAFSAEEKTALSLDKAVQLALERNPSVVSAMENIEAAKDIRKQARSQFLFKGKTSYAYTRLQETPTLQTFSIPGQEDELAIGTADNYNFEVRFDQPVFSGFAIITNYELAKLGLDTARVQLESVKLQLVRDVKIAFFDVLLAEKRIAVAQQSMKNLESEAKRAKDFYEVGMTPKTDYLRANVEFLNAKQSLIVAENNLTRAIANFNRLLRMPVDQAVDLEDLLKYAPYFKTLEESYQAAHLNRPELSEADLALQSAKKQVKLSQSGFYPNVVVSFSYRRFGDSFDLQGSEFEQPETWDATAALDWTFWEWGRTKYEVSEKRRRVKQTEQAIIQLQDAVDVEVKSAFTRMRDAERNIDVQKKAIEQSEESFRMESERYQQQVTTITDVLNAEFQLARAQDDYYSTLYAYNTALADLKRAIGELD